MSVYDDIFEHLQDAVDCGELPEEFAEAVNDLAYDKYCLDNEFDESAVNKHYDNIRSQKAQAYKDLGAEIYRRGGDYHAALNSGARDKINSLERRENYMKQYATRGEAKAIKGEINNLRNHTDNVVDHPFASDPKYRNLRPDERIALLQREGQRKKALINGNSAMGGINKATDVAPDKQTLSKIKSIKRDLAMKKLARKYKKNK